MKEAEFGRKLQYMKWNRIAYNTQFFCLLHIFDVIE